MSIDAGIYGGGPLYSGGDAVIGDLRSSGMTTIVAWAVHVHPNGDLIFNDPVIVSGGEYVGEADWPALLASLKAGPTSVDRLLFSIGGWDTGDFENVKQLMADQGTGPDSILYRNFAALKSAIPTIDGIDFDDESLYDEATTVAFAQMLQALGFEVTFCPYTETDFWVGCLKTLNETTPGLVTGFNLQCYAGGAGNTPGPWIEAIAAAMGPDFDAAGFVRPGLWCTNGPDCQDGQDPAQIEATLAEWRSTGISGGWIWMLDDVIACKGSTAAYAEAITAGLG